MSTRGRRHTPSEKLLLKQVAEVFTRKKNELGADEVATALKISRASVYNYARGIDLPRMEVLRDAHKKWRIKWNNLDFSTLLAVKEIRTSEQLKLPFLNAVSEEDVEVAEVGSEKDNVLRLELKIRF